jgi:DNA-binding NarL/FixJ family response regulator
MMATIQQPTPACLDTPSPPPTVKPIRILLADDHDVMRLGLRTLLDSTAHIRVVGEARDGKEALDLFDSVRPDVVLMDVSMAGMDGVTATRELVRRQPNACVLALTMHDEDAYLVPLLDAGAMGYVVKSAASALLLDAVQTVASGRRYVRAEAAQVLADELARRRTRGELESRHETLSARERAVFLSMAQGHSSSEIGERLHISAKTVDTYRRRINDKLEIATRADYVRLALALGLLGSRNPPAGA